MEMSDNIEENWTNIPKRSATEFDKIEEPRELNVKNDRLYTSTIISRVDELTTLVDQKIPKYLTNFEDFELNSGDIKFENFSEICSKIVVPNEKIAELTDYLKLIAKHNVDSSKFSSSSDKYEQWIYTNIEKGLDEILPKVSCWLQKLMCHVAYESPFSPDRFSMLFSIHLIIDGLDKRKAALKDEWKNLLQIFIYNRWKYWYCQFIKLLQERCKQRMNDSNLTIYQPQNETVVEPTTFSTSNLTNNLDLNQNELTSIIRESRQLIDKESQQIFVDFEKELYNDQNQLISVMSNFHDMLKNEPKKKIEKYEIFINKMFSGQLCKWIKNEQTTNIPHQFGMNNKDFFINILQYYLNSILRQSKVDSCQSFILSSLIMINLDNFLKDLYQYNRSSIELYNLEKKLEIHRIGTIDYYVTKITKEKLFNSKSIIEISNKLLTIDEFRKDYLIIFSKLFIVIKLYLKCTIISFSEKGFNYLLNNDKFTTGIYITEFDMIMTQDFFDEWKNIFDRWLTVLKKDQKSELNNHVIEYIQELEELCWKLPNVKIEIYRNLYLSKKYEVKKLLLCGMKCSDIYPSENKNFDLIFEHAIDSIILEPIRSKLEVELENIHSLKSNRLKCRIIMIYLSILITVFVRGWIDLISNLNLYFRSKETYQFLGHFNLLKQKINFNNAIVNYHPAMIYLQKICDILQNESNNPQMNFPDPHKFKIQNFLFHQNDDDDDNIRIPVTTSASLPLIATVECKDMWKKLNLSKIWKVEDNWYRLRSDPIEESFCFKICCLAFSRRINAHSEVYPKQNSDIESNLYETLNKQFKETRIEKCKNMLNNFDKDLNNVRNSKKFFFSF
ncbi:hypothetical protein SNEBB_002911 [Seison nebaliae]|nr:hypothetical protein SNEBB_002911 [Seison nebaliae]